MSNRALRRQIEKKRRKESVKQMWQEMRNEIKIASRSTEAKLLKEQEEARMSEDAVNSSMAMYYLFGVHLHRIYGFGQQRLLRLFDAVDKSLGEWGGSGEKKSLDDLRAELKREVDIDIDFGDWRN